MGALFTKVLTKEEIVCEAFKRGKYAEAAELIYLQFVKEQALKIAPTLLTNVSKGQSAFSLLVIQNTKDTELLFAHILNRDKAAFDKVLLSRVKGTFDGIEVALGLSIDNKAFIINGAVLIKM